MAKQRILNTRFWSDEYIQGLDLKATYFYLYLITNEHTNIAGCYQISTRTMVFDTKLKTDEISKAIDRLSKDKKILYQDGWMVIFNFVKNQNLNPKIKKGIQRTIKELPEAILDRLCIDYDSLSIDYDKYKPKSELQSELKPQSKDHRGGSDLGSSKKGKEMLPAVPSLPDSLLSDPEFSAIWLEFRAHRAEIGHPLTPRAETMALQNLVPFAAVATQAVRESIANGWQGIFPEKIALNHLQAHKIMKPQSRGVKVR